MKLGLRRTGRVGAILLPFALAACQTLIKPPADGCEPDGCPKSVCDPKVLHQPTVHAAAWDLDHLEKHIDWHGSVVAKVPDVWGQARLTLYREQFEEQMAKELDRFELSLQGSIARQDQAFLLNATALSASLETPVRGPRRLNLPAGRYLRRGADGNLLDPTNKDNITVLDKDQTILIPSLQATPSVVVQKPDGTFTTVPGTPALPPTTSVFGVSAGGTGTTNATAESFASFFGAPGFNTAAFQGQFLAPGGQALKIGLEPERYLEQKKRYLDLLAQIRRANEGDDTGDSPGYSLQLFRIPVSVLPGKRTDVGHGAEITMTLTPVLGDDLLPTTFRSLVINDLVDQLGFPLTKFLGEDEARNLLREEYRWIVRNLPVFDKIKTAQQNELAEAFKPVPVEVLIAMKANVKDDKDLNDLLDEYIKAKQGTPSTMAGITATDTVEMRFQKATARFFKDTENLPSAALQRKRANLAQTRIAQTFAELAGLKTPFSPGTRNRQAMPSSQYMEVYGAAFAFEIAFKANQALGKQIQNAGYVHLPDVQAFLKQELDAAYQMLARDVNHDLLDEFCTSQLVNWIRTRQGRELLEQRNVYRERLKDRTDRTPSPAYGIGDLDKDPKFTTTAALGWALIVDSALLTDRFIADMKSASSGRGVVLPQCGVWLDYYRPCPSPEARQAFNEYVRCRWPIHVFALDPAIQEQNLADRLATRRELQLALSLAFSHGFMNFNQLTRYARRLEAEYETIDLNRTQVGFAHGSDTFGWRFYPRYQTPDTPGNLTVIARDLIVGGPNKNQLLRERRLEPGPRECVALVIMPSFVPAVTLDTTSNFFGLTNPKHKVFDHTQAVKLGKTVQAIKTAGCGLTDAHCYRDGDAARLVKRAEQLEARLPLQTVTFPVPTEDTVGGFELFSNNTTDLAPELYGFYGAPGADNKKKTTLFLVGDHFSPLRTRVIVGNKAISPDGKDGTKLTMISRQVVQVEFGPDFIPLNARHLTVHVATPYGVSRELLVPLVKTSDFEADGYYLASESGPVIEYTTADVIGSNPKQFNAQFAALGATPVVVQARFASGVVPEKVRVEIDGVAGAIDVTAAATAPGVYPLPAAELEGLIKVWFRNYIPATDKFNSTTEVERKLPPVLQLRVTPFVGTQLGTTQKVNGVVRITARQQKPLPPPAASFGLVFGAKVEIACQLEAADNGRFKLKTTDVTAATIRIEAIPAANAPAKVKIGIVDSTVGPVELTGTNGVYTADAALIRNMVVAWVKQRAGDRTFASVDEFEKSAVPTPIRLLLIPDGSTTSSPLGNDVFITVKATVAK